MLHRFRYKILLGVVSLSCICNLATHSSSAQEKVSQMAGEAAHPHSYGAIPRAGNTDISTQHRSTEVGALLQTVPMRPVHSLPFDDTRGGGPTDDDEKMIPLLRERRDDYVRHDYIGGHGIALKNRAGEITDTFLPNGVILNHNGLKEGTLTVYDTVMDDKEEYLGRVTQEGQAIIPTGETIGVFPPTAAGRKEAAIELIHRHWHRPEDYP